MAAVQVQEYLPEKMVEQDEVSADLSDAASSSSSAVVDGISSPAKEDLSSRTVIVFDWDDTLLASTWLTSAGLKVDEPFELTGTLKTDLHDLETAVITLVTVAQSYGSVVIITNAETGWVELSASRFVPRVLPYLKDLRIVSARSTYEANFPNSPQDWKIQAFTEEIKRATEVFNASPSNILSIGDSHTEREACHQVGRTVDGARVKSVKFIERPTIEQLRKQIELVTSNLQSICAYEGSLDLLLTSPMVASS